MAEEHFDNSIFTPVPYQPPAPLAPPLRGAFRVEQEQPEEKPIPAAHYLWILQRQKWKILGFIVAVLLGTIIVSKRLQPIYESTAAVDIDREMPHGIVGEEASRATMNDADKYLTTQLRLVRSDAVLRPVAMKYRLLEKEHQLDNLSPERAARMQEAPTALKKLKVTRPPNTYLLLISYSSPDPQLAAAVANAVAQSYIETSYNIRFRSSAGLSAFMEKQLEELKAKMEKSSTALVQFERELNVINPEEKTNITSSRLLQLNTEFTNAQVDRVAKESAWKSMTAGTLEAAQVSSQAEALKAITERLNAAEQKFADVKTHFGANHPEYRKAAGQIEELQRQLTAAKDNIRQRIDVEYRRAVDREEMLKRAVAQTKTEFDNLNARSFEYQSLKREADADKKLYEELVQKIREAGINAGFQNSAIRLADLARPPVKPVFPNIKLNMLLALVFSSVVAVAGAIVADMMDNTVRDPEQVNRFFNTEVMGILPVVQKRSLLGTISGSDGNRSSKMLMRLSDAENGGHATGFVEAVRTLRNSILLSSLDRHLGCVLVTSAAPKEGKTTTAVHLALSHAEQKHRTLIIDCDLRRPSVHRYFGMKPEIGLAAVLAGELSWRDAVIHMDNPTELHLLPAGHSSRAAADLVGHSLPAILAEARKEYDLIVVDAPPMLGFAEPLQIATMVDGVIVITLAGETKRKAVGVVVNSLARVHANVIGLVLNKMSRDLYDGYYYYGHYSSYQKYYEKRAPVES